MYSCIFNIKKLTVLYNKSIDTAFLLCEFACALSDFLIGRSFCRRRHRYTAFLPCAFGSGGADSCAAQIPARKCDILVRWRRAGHRGRVDCRQASDSVNRSETDLAVEAFADWAEIDEESPEIMEKKTEELLAWSNIVYRKPVYWEPTWH